MASNNHWQEGYPVDFSEGPDGDTTSIAIYKFMQEFAKVYGHLEDLRSWSAGPVSPLNPVTNQIWLNTTDYTIYYWNGYQWVSYLAVNRTAVADKLKNHEPSEDDKTYEDLKAEWQSDNSAHAALNNNPHSVRHSQLADKGIKTHDEIDGHISNDSIHGSNKRAINIVVDGGGEAIPPGVKCDVQIPFTGVIKSVSLMGDQVGSISMDIWKSTPAAFPPVSSGSIVGSAPPMISSAQFATDGALTGWTTAITAGDVLRIVVTDCVTITRVTLNLEVEA